MSNFAFLGSSFPEISSIAQTAERYVSGDPRTSCFHARRSLESIVSWLYENDSRYQYPYDTNLNALMRDASFERNVPFNIQNKAQTIRRMGNSAVHDNRPVSKNNALTIIKELFQVTYWLARTYGDPAERQNLPDAFDEKKLPPSQATLKKNTTAMLKTLAAQVTSKEEELRKERAKAAQYAARLEELEARLAAKVAAEAAVRAEAQAEVNANRIANEAITDTHNYNPNEADTRRLYIDILLREAGWTVPGPEFPDLNPGGVSTEYPVTGMPIRGKSKGNGYVDYVLWGDDGLPLAVVEAKKTTRDPHDGKQQAKLYADALQAMHGQRPIIFTTNGFRTYLWDDTQYPEREVQGFYTKDELAWLIQRRQSAESLDQLTVKQEIVNRYYQIGAITALTDSLYAGRRRKGLFVMATGTGKTRTAIATVDLLMRAKWIKRVLFLADRTSLVHQAIKAFKKHLPDANPVNLVEDKEAAESRVVVSTYPTMLNQIEKFEDGRRLFSIGHFDLIIIDEAHRSVYQKYGAIFDYFDSLLLGLTATPKDEVDRNTYNLFDLEEGVPTYAYDLGQGVADGHLVPPNAINVPTTFTDRGIRYDDLSDEEQAAYDLLDWGEMDDRPEEISSSQINKWLFNQDTVDAVLKNLMENGIKVAGGDRLGKTIIFAKNQTHANYISERFGVHYPEMRNFARVITSRVEYSQSLIDAFEEQEKTPHIAISVDMLDTGIDVPPVVNLVFFKLVRSKTKFFQMLGRGTRLCPDLFGPGQDKTHFNVFDHCKNFEFFDYHPDGVTASVPRPLSERLFIHRLNLLAALQPMAVRDEAGEAAELSAEVRDILHGEVSALNTSNFIVRPKLEYVERYNERTKWDTLTQSDYADLQNHVAPIPSNLKEDKESAKRFDSLILQLQISLVEQTPVFQRLQNRIITLAEGLEQAINVPAVAAHKQLIFALQDEEIWGAMSLKRLEEIRLALRGLVDFVPKGTRPTLYTNFKDELHQFGESGPIYEFASSDLAQYKKKVEHFIKASDDIAAIYKIRNAIPLNADDLETLEAFFFQADPVGSREAFEEAYPGVDNLALFIRGLTGLSRKAAKEKFSKYLDQKRFTAEQITFVNYVIDQLTQAGRVELGMLYERPFTDLSDQGIDGVFQDSAAADELVALIESVNQVVTRT